MEYIWYTNIGPRYRCTDQDGNEVLQVHQDLSTAWWRVSYPDGRSNLHSGTSSARREAEEHMARLGDRRSLGFIVP